MEGCFDSLGNITAVTDNNGNSVTYSYDYLGQLVSETRGGVTNTITYDERGNITQKDGITYHYAQADWQDILFEYGDQPITYDLMNNPYNWRDDMNLSWTANRQLSEIWNRNISYSYDSSGIRYQKVANGKTYTFTYVDGKLIHQTDGTNTWWFYYEPTGKLVALDYNGTLYYYMYDSIGNIFGLVDANGTFVANYTYDAWGKILSATGDMAEINPIRYKGYYYDTESGFYYLMSRYYDPVIGRFLNADSFAGTGQGVLGYNMYAYCNNNPIALEDSQGTRPIASTTVRGEDPEERAEACAFQRQAVMEKLFPPKPTNVNNTDVGIWPLDSPPLPNAFNDFPRYGGNTGNLHNGCDFPKVTGANVYSSFNALVSSVYTDYYSGLTISVQVIIIDTEYTIYYKHLSKVLVSPGQYVTPGELIGFVGATGYGVTGSHLHFEMRINGEVQDPRPLLRKMVMK